MAVAASRSSTSSSVVAVQGEANGDSRNVHVCRTARVMAGNAFVLELDARHGFSGKFVASAESLGAHSFGGPDHHWTGIFSFCRFANEFSFLTDNSM